MIIGDFHIHGPYAQACSRNTTLEKLETYAKIKGLNILGTGDFQHPKWNEIIKKELTEDENGILWSKTKFPFIWQTEISLAYTQGGKGRRIHLVVLAPGKDVANQVIDTFSKKWRIDYDGRPIFGISCIEFTELLMDISKDIEIIPAHNWTSFFGCMGSKTGFDSVEECFEDRAKYIHAIETGLSSNPLMNRLVSKLDKYNLVSFSDPHSYFPWRLGREATMFDIKKITYKEILKAIRTGEGLAGTIETNPEYGKYHVDGHRACNVVTTYEETKKLNGICPKCKTPLTLGVEYRVKQLADRDKPVNVPNFKEVIPLTELIAAVYSLTQLASKKVWEVYNLLIKRFSSEFNVLLEASYEELAKVVDKKLADVIIRNREGKLEIKPGYDGVYGQVVLNNEEKVRVAKQKSLIDF